MGDDEREGESELQLRRRAWLEEGHFEVNHGMWLLCLRGGG